MRIRGTSHIGQSAGGEKRGLNREQRRRTRSRYRRKRRPKIGKKTTNTRKQRGTCQETQKLESESASGVHRGRRDKSISHHKIPQKKGSLCERGCEVVGTYS